MVIVKAYPWKQFELHIPLEKEYVETKRKLQELGKIISQKIIENGTVKFYYNYYISKDDAFIKLGLFDATEYFTNYILEAAKGLGATIKEGSPDLRSQEGIVIDDLKHVSTQIAIAQKQALKEFAIEKLTVGQMYLVLHILMNQLGYSYDEELDVYVSLAYNVRFGRKG